MAQPLPGRRRPTSLTLSVAPRARAIRSSAGNEGDCRSPASSFLRYTVLRPVRCASCSLLIPRRVRSARISSSSWRHDMTARILSVSFWSVKRLEGPEHIGDDLFYVGVAAMAVGQGPVIEFGSAHEDLAVDAIVRPRV